ncbi:L-type lectin-domain containing receptor kinase IX.1-like [Cryptomeria japonica]|uniref:L-type lectin-domain containing receptor kinase IX.1-like n=1 Tax=Cryptomeria japonica TaxID=3369 RepID=UPI0027DA6BBD|nr:L-type lectin-domain containing receptor kinase IX.1-like [Cryptomeria japonica]
MSFGVLRFSILFWASALVVLSEPGSLITFNFPSFDNSSSEDIELLYDSHIERNGRFNFLQLTRNDGGIPYSEGWATYKKSIPVWDTSSQHLANFTTHFEFFIKPDINNTFGPGEGLTFFMAPLDFKAPESSAGKWLGLFNTTTVGKSWNRVAAVEFDTDKISHDPDDNHVGIDVNSIVSAVNYSLVNGSLKDGRKWRVWVDYDGRQKKLQVFLAGENKTKSGVPILKYGIDLRQIVPADVKIGFSATTGMGRGTHTLLYWDFICRTSWNASSVKIKGSNPVNDEKKKKKDEKVSKSKFISVSVVLSFLAVACCLGSGWLWRRYMKTKRRAISTTEEGQEDMDTDLDEQVSKGPRRFTFSELSAATKSFSEDEKLGQGGFGSVYRGVLEETEEVVAVKRISEASRQGKKEYVAEVSIITRLGHRNLVQLLGWCHEKGKLLLVYEFMSNGSLDKHIFRDSSDSPVLDWDHRYSIACGIASALVYLHEDWDQCVLHRDVKSSNVMLDSNFNAKLGDFGLARLVERDMEASEHTTVVAGTLGYLAPECVITGKSTPESDVYSFGAVALEIACGRRALDQRLRENFNLRLVKWVWDLFSQGRVLDAAAESMRGEFNGEEIERLMVVGLWCSHPDPTARPSMREALRALRLETLVPCIPVKMPVTVYLCRDPIRPRDVLSSALFESK